MPGNQTARQEAAGYRFVSTLAGDVLIELGLLGQVLHEVAWSPRKLMSGAVGERLRGRRPRRRPPARPLVAPAACDALPLRGRAIDPNRGHAFGLQRVVFALQAVLVLHDIAVPGIARLDVQPPCAGVDVLAVGVVHGIQARIVAVVIGEAVVVTRGTDFRAGGVQVDGLIIPARVHVQVHTRKPRCFLRQAGVLTVAGAVIHSDNAKARVARRCGAAVGPGYVKASRAGRIQGRRCRRRCYTREHRPGQRSEEHGCSTETDFTACTLHVLPLLMGLMTVRHLS